MVNLYSQNMWCRSKSIASYLDEGSVRPSENFEVMKTRLRGVLAEVIDQTASLALMALPPNRYD